MRTRVAVVMAMALLVLLVVAHTDGSAVAGPATSKTVCHKVNGKKVCKTATPKPKVKASPTPRPTNTPVPVPTTDTSTAMGQLLTSLHYEHATSSEYSVGNTTWQGHAQTVLWHTDPTTKEKRIDGMKATIEGQEQWVRGLYYEASDNPKFGGFIIDAVMDTDGKRIGFTDPDKGPNVLYNNTLLALSHQLGISEEQLKTQMDQNDNKAMMHLPSAHPGASVSAFYASNLTKVDLGKPISYSYSPYYPPEGIDLANDIPDTQIFTYAVTDSRVRNTLYIDKVQQLRYINFPSYTGYQQNLKLMPDNKTLTINVWLIDELLAQMTPVDHEGTGQPFIAKITNAGGTSYQPGASTFLVLPREQYWWNDYNIFSEVAAS